MGELCISGKLLRSLRSKGSSLPSGQVRFRNWCEGLPRNAERSLELRSDEMEILRQHVALFFLHRAELLYLECWKGTRILAAKLPQSGKFICFEPQLYPL